MNCDEAQKLLKKARKCALSPKVKRDAAVIFALEKQLGFSGIQSMLFDLGLPSLGEGKYHE
jgi:hypothetical protein